MATWTWLILIFTTKAWGYEKRKLEGTLKVFSRDGQTKVPPEAYDESRSHGLKRCHDLHWFIYINATNLSRTSEAFILSLFYLNQARKYKPKSLP